MDRTSNSEWNEEMDIRNFGDLLQQMNAQFTQNEESPHYHSGFVPAASPPWTSQHPHPHMLQMDPTLNSSPLGTQVGMNPLRSFSVSQYPDMDCGRTPLMRSSSDLGVRLSQFPTPTENFSDCQLQGIDPHIETLDSSVFYPPNPHFHSGSPYQQIPVTTNDKIIMNQNPGLHYSSYVAEPERVQQNEQSTCNLSTKLSNFTASLSIGTWLSPLDQIRTNYNQGRQISDNSGTASGMQENFNSNSIQTSSIMCSKAPDTSPNFSKEPKPQINPKPRYSDVLSKAPTHEGKSFGNPKTSNQQNSSSYKFRESTSKCSNSRPNKHRNNNIGFGRSSSPNLTFHNSSNYATDNNNINTKNLKFDSKVGLDDFDLPVSISQCNSTSVNSTVSNNSNNSENERTKKRTTSNNNNESSPCHQYKKGSKYDKSFAEKMQDELESTHCDKLNNHSLATQQKQTPKRTTYINNNFSSFSVNVSKNSNSENNNNNSSSSISSNNSNSSMSTFQNRKNFSTAKEDDAKLHCESGGNVANSKFVCNIQSSSSSVPLSSSGSGSSSLNKSGSGGGGSNNNNNNFRSGRYGNRAERNRENQSKRSIAYSKKKKEASPYTHSELLMTGWTICLMWAGKAGLWLLSLITDVAQMSYRLLIHFSLRLFEKGKICYAEAKHAFKYQWTKIVDYFFRKKIDGKKGGRNDRKFPFGLENNIPLPTTGEEAMKRLLACRGKDPYSILGVTRDCTDDDIKKYYKRQAFLVHPDKNKQPGAEEAFKILAHAFEIIGEPERREAYNNKLAEEAHLEGASSELASLLNLLKEKLEEAANTIHCTNCNKRHRRTKLPRPVYAARHCAECQIRHAAREGDIWAESWHIGLWWKYYACMEGSIYDISEWASCQRDNLKHLQANTHSVQYRIVSGKKNSGGKTSTPECPTDPELEEFFNNLCRERFGQDFVPGNSNQAGSSPADARRRRGKKKK